MLPSLFIFKFFCSKLGSMEHFIKFTKTIEEDEYRLLQRLSEIDFEYIDFIVDNMYHRLIYKAEREKHGRE